MRTESTRLTGELHTGDLIIVAQANWLDVGYYLGYGQGDSRQYYSLELIDRWIESGYKRKKPFVSFYNSSSSWRVAKYPPTYLEGACLEKYEKSIEAMKRLNII